MKTKIALCLMLIFSLLLCGCVESKKADENADSAQTACLDGKTYVLNKSTYGDFVNDSWVTVTEGEPALYKVTIEEKVHYEFEVQMERNGIFLSNAVFITKEPEKELEEWVLASLTADIHNAEKIELPVDVLKYETADELESFLLDTFHSSQKVKNGDNVSETGVVQENVFTAVAFSEEGERLSVCLELDDIMNSSKTVSRYEKEKNETQAGKEESSLTQVEERHGFAYGKKVYVVGKHKLTDFIEDGWTPVTQYSMDELVGSKYVCDVEYLKKDDVVIGPLLVANGTDKAKALKDCTVVRCTIPLNNDIGQSYDNSKIVLPHSLQATMNGEEISDIFTRLGDYGCRLYEEADRTYISFGIVSAYNVGATVTKDMKTFEYLSIEINDFYVTEFDK